MAAPTVHIFNAEPQIFSELFQRLKAFGISVEKMRDWNDLNVVFRNYQNYDCTVINVDLGSFTPLLNADFFTKVVQQKHSPVIALVRDDSLKRIIERESGDQIHILSANILLDKLVNEILNALPILPEHTTDSRFISSAFGKTNEFPVSKLLEYFSQIAFSGIVIVENQFKSGQIFVEKGHVQKVDYMNFPSSQALDVLLSLKNASFRVEQRIFTLSDMTKYFAESNTEHQLVLNDVLVDMFYYMHTHFEKFIDTKVIEDVVESVLIRHETGDKNTIYITYNPNWQEKIRIIGNLNQDQASYILTLFEHIFDELSTHTSLNSFGEFMDSLEEIKPYMLTVQDIQKMLEDKKVPVM